MRVNRVDISLHLAGLCISIGKATIEFLCIFCIALCG